MIPGAHNRGEGCAITVTEYATAILYNGLAEYELAFEAAGEELDVVVYVASGRDRGKFLHIAPDGGATVVHEPNAYTGLPSTSAHDGPRLVAFPPCWTDDSSGITRKP